MIYMRKNIFDLIKESYNFSNDIERIHQMVFNEKTIYISNYYSAHSEYSIGKYVSDECFKDWKGRGHCIDLKDFLKSANYDFLREDGKKFIESFLLFLELILNIYNLANNNLKRQSEFSDPIGNYFHVLDVIKDCLDTINYKAYYYEDKEIVLLVENREEVTAVADILPQELAIDVIKYNHHTLKGNIAMKKAILLRLGSELEPQRTVLNSKDKELEANIFFMLNNLNLRHNNTVEGDKCYKKKVAEMKLEELEVWYDELYQLILIGFLTIDNIERSNRVDMLKKEINI